VAVARYLADKSAYARMHLEPVRERLAPLLTHGLVATCPLVDLEILFSCRSPDEYESVLLERAGLERVEIEPADWDAAVGVQRALAAAGRHRVAGIPDLLLAAVALRHRLVLLHYDQDFDAIATVTGQPVEWVVPQGSTS
jgi:predicted nucleic acid-binding protein